MATGSIYLVMDMINDLVHEDGPNRDTFVPEVKRRRLIPKTQEALRKARAAGLKIGYVRVGFSPDYRECWPKSPQFGAMRKAGILKLGTWGTEVHPDLTPEAGDFDIVKHRVSPFYGTNLEPLLRANGIGRIYMSGVSTNYVVQATAREGHDRDYECVILEDCCCALSQEEHDWAIKGLSRPARITTVGEVDFAAA